RARGDRVTGPPTPRRSFLTLLAASAAAWPLAARAQQRTLPVIGVLGSGQAEDAALRLAAFAQALRQAGFVEGQNVAFEYRWANDQYDRLPAMAADLVRARVSLIYSTPNNLPPPPPTTATT